MHNHAVFTKYLLMQDHERVLEFNEIFIILIISILNISISTQVSLHNT